MWRYVSDSVLALTAVAALSACTSCSENEPEVSATEWTVVEYMPGPGQFINERTDLRSMADACAWATGRLSQGLSVSLGSFGGYVVVSASGRSFTEFTVTGNSFVDDLTGAGGSNEPGIVFVMTDTDGNGLPDDGPWRELSASELSRPCSVTYCRPSAAHSPVPWCTSWDESGEVAVNSYHRQDSYFPAWAPDTLTFADARRIDSRVYLDSVSGQWILPPYEWGYADNCGADRLSPGEVIFRLDSPAHFIRVQTAVLASAGHLGELSTEVTAFRIVK